MRLTRDDVKYIGLLFVSVGVLSIVNYAFSVVLNYTLIVFVSYYIVTYCMDKFDILRKRWSGMSSRFIILLIGILLSAVVADLYLQVIVPSVQSHPLIWRAPIASGIEVACVMATLSIEDTSKNQ